MHPTINTPERVPNERTAKPTYRSANPRCHMDPRTIDPDDRYVGIDMFGRCRVVETAAGMPHAAVLFAQAVTGRLVNRLDEQQIYFEPTTHVLVWYRDLLFAVYRACDRPDVPAGNGGEAAHE